MAIVPPTRSATGVQTRLMASPPVREDFDTIAWRARIFHWTKVSPIPSHRSRGMAPAEMSILLSYRPSPGAGTGPGHRYQGIADTIVPLTAPQRACSLRALI